MQLSDHFTLAEFIASSKAAELGIDNTVPSPLIPSLQYGCEHVLEPIRDLLGTPLLLGPRYSGFRCDALNAAVGGVPTSQHRRAQAADFFPEGQDHRAAFDAIARSGIPYDQLILEPSWIHVSWNPNGEPRRECLVAHPGTAVPFSPYIPNEVVP